MAMKLLITSGGTTEAIDAVRGITNHSTGQLGKIIAETFLAKGFDVTLVTTKTSVKPAQQPHLTIREVTNVDQLMAILKEEVPKHDLLIHSMAVSDYSPVYMTDFDTVAAADHLQTFLTASNKEAKISSAADYQVLFLKKTPKIISYIKEWNPNIRLVGFKLLVNASDEELISVARDSLHKNKADYIVANDLADIKANQHKAFLVDDKTVCSANTKEELAQLIYERIIAHD
ncbi:TPA: phosphopantothenate--cysteine ligase [Streptococcus equi subsp. zooepidemicus]|nr:phosphopantothenate--cysteine ligase [Streptococcus equi subsp. zooepidemicus]HEL0628047.1 phosphopantothenate--cysteine ligase [Streptococcus equi subsp. zooepidemicus]HEL0724849.1 phosphopantothenate--cysteine ligase [Streptococcus equi subsp. zooepidemicus]